MHLTGAYVLPMLAFMIDQDRGPRPFSARYGSNLGLCMNFLIRHITLSRHAFKSSSKYCLEERPYEFRSVLYKVKSIFRPPYEVIGAIEGNIKISRLSNRLRLGVRPARGFAVHKMSIKKTKVTIQCVLSIVKTSMMSVVMLWRSALAMVSVYTLTALMTTQAHHKELLVVRPSFETVIIPSILGIPHMDAPPLVTAFAPCATATTTFAAVSPKSSSTTTYVPPILRQRKWSFPVSSKLTPTISGVHPSSTPTAHAMSPVSTSVLRRIPKASSTTSSRPLRRDLELGDRSHLNLTFRISGQSSHFGAVDASGRRGIFTLPQKITDSDSIRPTKSSRTERAPLTSLQINFTSGDAPGIFILPQRAAASDSIRPTKFTRNEWAPLMPFQTNYASDSAPGRFIPPQRVMASDSIRPHKLARIERAPLTLLQVSYPNDKGTDRGERCSTYLITCRLFVNAIKKLLAGMPQHQRRNVFFIVATSIILIISIVKHALNRCDSSSLRLRLVDFRERARSIPVQSLLYDAWLQCISLDASLMKYFFLPSIHEPSTESLETGLWASPHVDTGSFMECAVPELESTSLVVSQPARPQAQVARLRLVAVSNPRCVDLVSPSPRSKRPRIEKDGVDCKDTFALAFESKDPWAHEVASTLLQVQETALRSPSSQPHSQKTGGITWRDDVEVIPPLRVKKRRECMHAFGSESEEAMRAIDKESLDLGTRVANLQARLRFNSDTMSSIFEGSIQTRCVVFSLIAEVGRTVDFRRYRKEIEYIMSAAKRENPPTQSTFEGHFKDLYVDDHYDLLVQLTKCEKYVVEALDRTQECHTAYQTALRENARYIMTILPGEINALVNTFFERPGASVEKKLKAIEKKLLRRAEIDERYLTEIKWHRDLHEIAHNNYSCAAYDYIDADETERWEETSPSYYAEILTRRVNAYRMLSDDAPKFGL